IVLDRVKHTGLVDPTKSYTVTDTFTLPLVVTNGFPTPSATPLQGRFHLFVRTDADSAVFMNERRANTVAEAGNPFDVTRVPFADLVVKQVTVPAAARTGQPLRVSWEVINQGIGVTMHQLLSGNFAVDQGWIDTVSLATDPAGNHIVKRVSD